MPPAAVFSRPLLPASRPHRRRHRLSLVFVVGILVAAALLTPVRAGETNPAASSVTGDLRQSDQDPFRRGEFDLQVMSGVLFSLQRTTFLRPNLDYDLGAIRLGYMFDNAYGRGFLRGNDEFMLEGAGGSIFVGPGAGLGGLSLIYRRNFLFPTVQARWVPYLDLGGGGVYSDAYHTHPQRELGSPGEFDLQAGVGLRFRVTRHWSLDAEVDFRHLSNADISGRNYGTNDLGGLIGVSRSF